MKSKKQQRFDRLVLALINNPSASLLELAEAADISKTTLYRLGGSRENLVHKAITYAVETANNILDSFVPDVNDAQGSLLYLVQKVLEQAESMQLIISCKHLRTEAVQCLASRWNKKIDHFFLEGQKQGVFCMEVSAATLTEMLGALITGLIEAEQRGRVAKQDILTAIEKSFLYGVLVK